MPAPRKVSDSQLHVLIAYMLSDLDFARGRFTQNSGPVAKQITIQKWQRLARKLNCLESGITKTAKEWRNYWNNLKYKVRIKTKSAVPMYDTRGEQIWDLTKFEQQMMKFIRWKEPKNVEPSGQPSFDYLAANNEEVPFTEEVTGESRDWSTNPEEILPAPGNAQRVRTEREFSEERRRCNDSEDSADVEVIPITDPSEIVESEVWIPETQYLDTSSPPEAIPNRVSRIQRVFRCDNRHSRAVKMLTFKKMKIEVDIRKEKLAIAKRERYKLDLEILKLERELGIQRPSSFTLPFHSQNGNIQQVNRFQTIDPLCHNTTLKEEP